MVCGIGLGSLVAIRVIRILEVREIRLAVVVEGWPSIAKK